MRSPFKTILAIAIAALFALVFVKSVYFDFERKRTDLLLDAKAAPDGSLEIRFDTPTDKDVKIILLEAKNETSSTQKFQITLNDASILNGNVPAGSSQTWLIDAGDHLNFGNQNALFIKNEAAQSLVRKLEIRNMYGSLKTILTYVIVPRDSKTYTGAGILGALLLFLSLSFLGSYGQKRIVVFRNRIGLFPLITVSSFYLLIALMPVLSRYHLLLSFNSFGWLTFICYFSAVIASYVRIYQRADQAKPGGGRLFQSGVVVLGIFCFYFLSMRQTLMECDGNYSGFLSLSEKYLHRNPFLRQQPELMDQLRISPGYGYDSQFFYAITFDPFLQRFETKPGKYSRVVDSPPFRFRRIGFPLLTKLFSGDQPALYPKTMILLILFSSIPGAFFLVRIASFYQKNPSWGFLYLLVPAFTLSLHVGLPESIAAAFLLGGFYFYLKQKLKLSALFFAFSLLIRETTSLGIILLSLFELFKKKNKKNAVMLLSALLPYFAWRCYVAWKLFPGYGWRGLFYEPGNFNLPYYGIVQAFWNISKGTWPGVYSTGIIVFPFVLTAILLVSLWQLRKGIDFLPLATLLYSFLAVSLSYHAVWLSLGNPERQSFECFVFFILFFLSLDERRRSAKIACLSIFFFIFIYDFFFLSVGKYFRAGLLLN